MTRAARRTTGLGAAALFAAGSALWVFEQPDAGAPAQKVLAF